LNFHSNGDTTILFGTINNFICDVRKYYQESSVPPKIKHLLLLFYKKNDNKCVDKINSCSNFLLAKLPYTDKDLKGEFSISS